MPTVYPVTIDREDVEPVYQQLAGILRERIAAGQLAPRRPVPSVRQLVGEFGVNKATASKALHVLADEGLVVMVRGRGWFVSPRQD